LGGLAVAILAVNTVVKIWTTSQIILNAVLTANPIGIVIVAIAALAAGIIYAYRNSDTFRSIVKTAFDVVKTAAIAVKDAVLKIVDAIITAKDSPVVGALATWYKLQFTAIKTVVETVINVIESVIDAVRNVKDSKALSTIAGVFQGAFNAIKTTIEGVVSAVNSVTSALRTALGLFDSLFSRGKTLSSGEFLSGIRAAGRAAEGRSANGRLVKSAQSLVVGEQGPELILPLNRPGRVDELLGGRRGGTNITLNIYDRTTTGMSREQAKQIASDIAPHLSRQVALA
jgi:gas vesicle protein